MLKRSAFPAAGIDASLPLAQRAAASEDVELAAALRGLPMIAARRARALERRD
jgi:hypothetical protein